MAGSLLQPQGPGTFSTPTMGCNLELLDEQGRILVSLRSFSFSPGCSNPIS